MDATQIFKSVGLLKKSDINWHDYLQPSLIGAGVGAAGGGLLSAMGGDPEESGKAKAKRILGGVLGGGALGGTVGAGYQAVKGMLPSGNPADRQQQVVDHMPSFEGQDKRPFNTAHPILSGVGNLGHDTTASATSGAALNLLRGGLSDRRDNLQAKDLLKTISEKQDSFHPGVVEAGTRAAQDAKYTEALERYEKEKGVFDQRKPGEFLQGGVKYNGRGTTNPQPITPPEIPAAPTRPSVIADNQQWFENQIRKGMGTNFSTANRDVQVKVLQGLLKNNDLMKDQFVAPGTGIPNAQQRIIDALRNTMGDQSEHSINGMARELYNGHNNITHSAIPGKLTGAGNRTADAVAALSKRLGLSTETPTSAGSRLQGLSNNIRGAGNWAGEMADRHVKPITSGAIRSLPTLVGRGVAGATAGAGFGKLLTPGIEGVENIIEDPRQMAQWAAQRNAAYPGANH